MSIGNKLIHVRVNDKLHNSLNQRAKDTNRTYLNIYEIFYPQVTIL